MVDNIGRLRELCNSGNPKPLSDFLTSFADGDDIQWIVDAAEQGDSNAQFALSEYYLSGETNELAFHWAMKSAQQGNSWGENNLAYCYQHGFGVEKDDTVALDWYKKSANHGNTPAMSNIGFCYEYGIGTEKDAVTAFQWYLKSAEGGNPNAQNMIGDWYSEGLGTEEDADAAIMWYEKAVSNGIDDAVVSLLYIYWGARFGMPYKNYQKAAKILSDFHSIVPDEESVNFFLAFVYYFGVGVKADKNRAMEVWPTLSEIFSDDFQVPVGIKEMGFFFSLGLALIDVDKDCNFDSEVVNNLFLPLLSTYSRAIQNSSYEKYHLMLNSNGIYYKRGVRVGEFYQLLKSYDQDPWDVLQFASPAIREQLLDYLQNDQEEEFKKLMASEDSDLMARFRAYCMFRRLVDIPTLLSDTNEEAVEETVDKNISVVTENPEAINFMRERLMGLSEANDPADFVSYCMDSVVLLLGQGLMYSDLDNNASSILNYGDVRRLKEIVGQEDYKEVFDFVRDILFESANNEEETEEIAPDVTTSQDLEEDTVHPNYPTKLTEGRLRDILLQDVVCKKYLHQWFVPSQDYIQNVAYVFFGKGIKPENKLTFKGNKDDLACFIKYLNRDKGNGKVWDYFRDYLVDDQGRPVLATNPASNIKDKYDSYKKRLVNTILYYLQLNEVPIKWKKDIE